MAALDRIEYLAVEDLVGRLGVQMRQDSERWFPQWHDGSSGMPLDVAYVLGLAGEVGELANVIKKIRRDAVELPTQVEEELADVFTYLLVLADELGVDIVRAYRAKRVKNEERFGVGSAVVS